MAQIAFTPVITGVGYANVLIGKVEVDWQREPGIESNAIKVLLPAVTQVILTSEVSRLPLNVPPIAVHT